MNATSSALRRAVVGPLALLTALLLAVGMLSTALAPSADAADRTGSSGAAASASAAKGTAEKPTSDRYRRYYGSIALSGDGAAGLSYDYRTKKAAKKAAMRSCKARSYYPGRCFTVAWVSNGCLAVAVKKDRNGWITRYSWGIDYRLKKAKNQAKRRLGVNKVYTWVCTTR